VKILNNVEQTSCLPVRVFLLPRRQAGCLSYFKGRPIAAFTLMELVISAAVMSIILAASYACLNSGIAGQKLIESRSDAAQRGRVALSMISADLRNACAVFKGAPFIGMDRLIEDVEADNLDFATHNYSPKASAQGDYCEVSYFVSREPQSGQWSLWRRRDPTPDDEPLVGGSREEIVRGISGARFEYYDGFEWFDEWGDPEGRAKGATSLQYQPNLEGMPEAVRITLWIDTVPKKNPPLSGPAQKSATQPMTASPTEPPLVVQTVARLNLASINRTTSGNSATQESPAAVPPGNNP
jgi:general secretion pathway protein J